MTWELGLDTFGDFTGTSHAQTIRDTVAEGVLAEQTGVDFFGIGEHHTDDHPMPAADVVLAAIAAQTHRIRLGSAVTVLSSDDPVRVFQRFSTLDAISGGRAEVILGRGSSTESFPLFGYDLADYERLFDEKATLFARLLAGGPVTWQGTTRPALHEQDVVPHVEGGRFPAWIGVGGNPMSVVRAANLGYSLMLAVIGGPTARFAPFADLYRRAGGTGPIGLHSPGHVAHTDEQAVEEFVPHWLDLMRKMSQVRGFAVPTRASVLREIGPEGSLYVGSPETVAQKIATNLRVLGATRFDLKYGMGRLPHESLMTAIDLYGTKVAPMVRDLQD